VRGALFSGLLLAIVLVQACGGNGDEIAPSPTPTSTVVATASPMSSAQAIDFVQAYEVTQRVEREDGLWEVALVPLASRVEEYCADTPRWSTRDSGGGNWRVFAECQKQESVPADNPLIFEFLFYPHADYVVPWNYAAHVAQSEYPWLP
jgi:hypothetical protein